MINELVSNELHHANLIIQSLGDKLSEMNLKKAPRFPMLAFLQSPAFKAGLAQFNLDLLYKAVRESVFNWVSLNEGFDQLLKHI